jgi:serine/threonine protein kinase
VTFLSDRVVRHLQEVTRAPDLESTRYRAIDEIGRGGMGAVYRAYDEVLGREVAVKVTHVAASPAEVRARIDREARVLARLEHPGIVPVHDAGTLPDGRAFYVMKLVRGASLVDHLARVERLDERLRIFERICEAMAFAHANDVIHRDLKPANVMVGSFGEVLVLDWGLARIDAMTDANPGAEAPGLPGEHAGARALVAHGLQPVGWPDPPRSNRATEAGTVMGTPGFMAPEQARGDPVDRRADVYALGAMLVSMLVDWRPDEAGGVGVGGAEVRLRAGRVPVRLRAIALKAMAVVPEDRYADAASLAEDIARFRAGLTVSAHRETMVERAMRVVSLYRTPILLVLAYLVMRALVALYVARRR